MKQHITLEQFNDIELILNPDIEEPYEFWRYKLEEYGIEVDNCSDEFISEQFTIGKMIEISSENFKTVITQGNLWWVGNVNKTFSFNSEELCDALWECVKYVIAMKN